MELPLSWRPVEIEPSVEEGRTDRAPADRRNRALAGAERRRRREATTGPRRAPEGPARPRARSRAVVAERGRSDPERNEDRASGNSRGPVQREPQRFAVQSLRNQPTGGHRDRNQRRALSTVWWSTAKCFAIALTRTPRSHIAPTRVAIDW